MWNSLYAINYQTTQFLNPEDMCDGTAEWRISVYNLINVNISF